MVFAALPPIRPIVMLMCLVALADLTRAADNPTWVLPDSEQLAAQQDEIRQAAAAVDRLLDSADDGPAWRGYLLLDTLHAAIDGETLDDPIRQLDSQSDLIGIYNRLADDFPGLERDEFQSLRVAVRQHIRQLNAILTRRGAAESEARRSRLRELMGGAELTGEAQSECAQHLRWLDDRMQPIPLELVAATDSNLLVHVSADFIKKATLTSVVEPTDVNECIVGTRVIGDGTTTGQGWLSPIPDPQHARLVANFRGTLISDTVGYNGPVKIYSDGFTNLNGTAEVRVNADGLQVLGQTVTASATSRTKNVTTKFDGVLDRVVRKIAYRQIAKKKGQSDWESSYKARRSFNEEFAEDVGKQITEGDQEFQRLLRLPLLRRDLTPRQWDWSTLSTGLTTQMQFDGRARPTASVAPVASHTSGAINLSIHQSFLDNAAEGYLAGRLLSLGELASQAIGGSDESGSSIAKPADFDDVAVRLDDFHPLRCVFDGDEIKLNILGRQFVAGGSEYPAAVIVVTYRIAATDEGIKLHRVSSPGIVPTPQFARPPRFGIGGTALRAAVEPVLQTDLPQWIDLKPPAIEGEAPEVVRQLKITDVRTENGWLHVILSADQS